MSRGYETAALAARRFDWNINSYASNENGNAGYSYRAAERYAAAFGVTAQWLYAGSGVEARQARKGRTTPIPRLTPVVGALLTNGARLLGPGEAFGFTPPPPGGSPRAVALRVDTTAMGAFGAPGDLIYFEAVRLKPSPEMMGRLSVVETRAGRIGVWRLQRGARRGVYDLQGLDGAVERDVGLSWAAPVIALVPALHAAQILSDGAAP